MSYRNRNLIAGVIVFSLGAVSLLLQLQPSVSLGSLFILFACLLAAALFYRHSRQSAAPSASRFPAFLLAIAALLILVQLLFPQRSAFSLALILYAFSAYFAHQFTRKPTNWAWVVVSGALFTVGTISLLGSFSLLSDANQLAVFWSGLALTFLFLRLQRTPKQSFSWTWMPIIGFLLLAFFIHLGTFVRQSEVFVPILFLLIGIGFIVQSILKHRRKGKAS
ncbi:hypothetical protein JW992_13270 [candidate division KSB1 bacterium]|nr:hypothetical protein [candidate division KSB1 bacterium]